MHLHDIGTRHFFYVQRFTFAALGIDPLSPQLTVKKPIFLIVPFLSIFCVEISVIVFIIEHIKNIDLITNALSPLWQSMLAMLKIAIFLYKRKEMKNLIRKLWQWRDEATASEKKIIARENVKDIVFCYCYHMAVLLSAIVALVAPFVLATLSYIKYKKFQLQAPLKGHYFLNPAHPFEYSLIFILQTLGIYFVIYGSVAIDSLFSWLVQNIISQFLILKQRMREAGVGANAGAGAAATNEIIKCIEYHRRTLEIAAELNDVFAEIIFIKFTVSCIQICCLAFQFSRGGELIDVIFHGIFLVSVGMQLIIYCYCGQRLKDQSNDVATCIYASFQWYKLPLPAQKLFVLQIMRAGKVCDLSGVFFVVDLSLYLWVFRTAASYVALLRTLDESG